MSKTFGYTVELSTEGDASPIVAKLVDADKAIRRVSGTHRQRFRFKRDEHRDNRLVLSLTLTAPSWADASELGEDAVRELFATAHIALLNADQPRPVGQAGPAVESQGYELASV